MEKRTNNSLAHLLFWSVFQIGGTRNKVENAAVLNGLLYIAGVVLRCGIKRPTTSVTLGSASSLDRCFAILPLLTWPSGSCASLVFSIITLMYIS